MRRPAVAALLLLGSAAAAGKPVPPPILDAEHVHPSGAFGFRTPKSWTVAPSRELSDVLEATGGDLLVRFLFRQRESGYDSLHVDCMELRLAGPMLTEPGVRYEFDFIGRAFGDRRALESAFVVRYDEAVRGHREWRQHNVTVVGKGQSLCIIGYAPAGEWKKSAELRALHDAVIASVALR